MKTLLFPCVIVSLMWLGSPALAHDEHCHVKGPDGKLVDDKDLKDKKACEAKGGLWQHHHLHCHKAGDDGKMVDFPGAKSQKACEAKGGQWTDHGHEAIQP